METIAINPTVTGGHKSRFCTDTARNRKVRLDAQGECNLTTLKEILAKYNRDDPADGISISMIFRRALAVYRSHIAANEETPRLMAAERERMNRHTILPRVGRKKRVKPSDASDANPLTMSI